ncbi:hypothetical protein BGZ49_003069 [Haplosporangium sp. Z 27]|nr:hypothetical protein BGZ49_003069 [Haplosporangium sp. Z 27]
MQRGIQAFTPDADVRDRDLFASPRNSGDFSRRVSAIMAPTRSFNQTEHLTQSPPLPSNIITTSIPAAASRNLNQRRVSLPAIMESPSSPNAPSLPRQSCDLGRPPLLRDTFHTISEPVDFRDDLSEDKTPTNSSPFQMRGNGSRDRTPQNYGPSILDSSLVSSRRKSVEIGGLFSPATGHSLQRRVSLDPDHILAEKTADGKFRRDSDASTSDTIISGPSSCSTLTSPLTGRSISNKSFLGESEELRIELSDEPSLIGRSTLHPPLLDEDTRSRASNSGARKSFDLRSFASSRQQVPTKEEGSSQDQNYRRRSIQEPFLTNDFEDDNDIIHSGHASKAPLSASRELMPRGNIGRSDSKRSSFSGSATISGRISRFWTNGPGKDLQENNGKTISHRKTSSAGSARSFGAGIAEASSWLENDFAKSSSTDGAASSTASKETGGEKVRTGVMSRFSGMWSHR